MQNESARRKFYSYSEIEQLRIRVLDAYYFFTKSTFTINQYRGNYEDLQITIGNEVGETLDMNTLMNFFLIEGEPINEKLNDKSDSERLFVKFKKNTIDVLESFVARHLIAKDRLTNSLTGATAKTHVEVQYTNEKDAGIIRNKISLGEKGDMLLPSFPTISDIRILLSAAQDKKPLDKNEISSFYRGNDDGLQWRGIVDQLALGNKNILNKCLDALEDSFNPFHQLIAFTLTGASGTGKTIHLRLLADLLVKDARFNDYQILWMQKEDDEEQEKDINSLINYLSTPIIPDTKCLIFIDNFTEERSAHIREIISKNLSAAIRKNAHNQFKIIISAWDEQDVYNKDFFDKNVYGKTAKKIVINKDQDALFLNNLCKHIVGKINSGATTQPHFMFDEHDVGKTKVFLLTYLLSRLTDLGEVNTRYIDQDIIDNKLREVVIKDLNALGNYQSGRYAIDNRLGLRDTFILMCYAINNGVSGLDGFDFLKFSDKINNGESDNFVELTTNFSEATELAALEDEKWRELKYYLRIIHPPKKRTTYPLLSLVHPALAQIVLTSSTAIFSGDTARKYLLKYIDAFPDTSVASYFVYYARRLKILKPEHDEEKMLLLIKRLLEKGNKHHAYISLLWKDKWLLKKQSDDHIGYRLKRISNAHFNYLGQSIEIIKEYIRITKGQNEWFIQSFAKWIKSSFLDNGIRTEFYEEVMKENKGNDNLRARLLPFILNVNKTGRSISEKSRLIFSNEQFTLNQINVLLKDGKKEELATLLLEHIDQSIFLFKYLPPRVKEYAIDRVALSSLILEYLFSGKEHFERFYQAHDKAYHQKLSKFLKIILSYKVSYHNDNLFLILSNSTDIDNKLKEVLHIGILNHEKGQEMFMKYLSRNNNLTYKVKFFKYESSFPDIVRQANNDFKENNASVSQMTNFNEMLFHVIIANEYFELLNSEIVNGLLQSYIEKIEEKKRASTYGFMAPPITKIFQLNISHPSFFDKQLLAKYKQLLISEDAVDYIDHAAIVELIVLNILPENILSVWLNKMALIVKPAPDKANDKYYRGNFQRWLILKKQSGFSPADERFILEYYDSIKENEYNQPDIPAIVLIGGCDKLSKETRASIYRHLLEKRRYKKVLLPYAIAFFQIDNDPSFLKEFISSNGLNTKEYLEKVYFDITEQGDAHYFNIFLSSGLTGLKEWSNIAQDIAGKVKEDFSENSFFSSVPAISLKFLVAGLSKNNDTAAVNLLRLLAKSILPDAQTLLTHYQHLIVREHCLAIVYTLLTYELLDEKIKMNACHTIANFLNAPDCSKKYPALLNYCAKQLGKNNGDAKKTNLTKLKKSL